MILDESKMFDITFWPLPPYNPPMEEDGPAPINESNN